jgi:hypothetical protein
MLIAQFQYLMWYLEKFKWFEVSGVRENTEKYERLLIKTGFFRESNFIDVLLFFTSLFILFWIIFGLLKKTYQEKSS